LRDTGAQISLIKCDLIDGLDIPKLCSITISGVVGDPVKSWLVPLKIKPYPGPQGDNIAPHISVVFVACDLMTDVDVILCSSAVSQLDELCAYNVRKCSVKTPSSWEVDAVTTRDGATGSHDMVDENPVVSKVQSRQHTSLANLDDINDNSLSAN